MSVLDKLRYKYDRWKKKLKLQYEYDLKKYGFTHQDKYLDLAPESMREELKERFLSELIKAEEELNAFMNEDK